METKVVCFSSKIIKDLQKFTSKDKTRDYLMNVVYNDATNNISATDGKICAKLDKVKFDVESKNSLFSITPVSTNKILLTEINLGYPNINRIFPNDLKEYKERSISLKGNKEFISIEISRLINELDHIINFSYLLKFPKENFICYEVKGHNQIIFKSLDSNLSIVLMPIRKEK